MYPLQVNFAAFSALVTIITGTLTAFGRRLHRSGIENGRTRLFFLPFRQSQDGPQIMNHGLEYASRDPAHTSSEWIEMQCPVFSEIFR